MDHVLHIVPFQLAYGESVIQLSRRLEADTIPCSFWGLDSAATNQLQHHPQTHTYVALLGPQVVGIGSVRQGTMYQRHLGELSVAVCPQYRRCGIARALVQHLELIASEHHIEVLKALIWTKNMSSRALFESLTYEHRATLYGEFKSPEFGEIDDCVYYKRMPSVRQSSHH